MNTKSHQFSKLLYCKETGLLEKFYIDYDREGKKIQKEKNLLNIILPFYRQSNLKSAMINTRTIVESAKDIANDIYIDLVAYGYHQYKVCETNLDAIHYRNEILNNSNLIQWSQIKAPDALYQQICECEQ